MTITRLWILLSVGAVAAACQAKPPAADTQTSAQPVVAEPTPSATESVPSSSSQPGAADAKRLPPSDTFETSAGPLSLTPIYHGTLAFGFQGKTIVVDPWSKAPEGALPAADLILLTDVHADHFDKPAIQQVKRAGTMIIAPPAVAQDLPEAKVLKNGEQTTALGIGITATPMYNLERGPAPGKLFHEKGRGNGYLLSFGDKTVYLSGDTECTPEMRALKNVDVALICMNLPYTMPPDEAAECVNAFKPKVVIPFHYRGSDLQVFKESVEKAGEVEVRLRDFYPD